LGSCRKLMPRVFECAVTSTKLKQKNTSKTIRVRVELFDNFCG
jgi:hypothetical protein